MIMFIIILIYLFNFCLSYDGPPVVETPLGRVQGSWKTSLEGRKYAAFEGIPYAKPPVGDLRFEEPQPVQSWAGIWDATVPQTCLQIGVFTDKKAQGSEDCLYLNVYLPADILNDSNTSKTDVIVYIHAGAFTVLSGHSLEPKIIMDRDLIYVSMNFRLSIFGFLSTEDGTIPGNNGLKDQVLALKWVQDNIASFGGNPNSVTLVGVSSGGISVHLHYFSPLSKGLFTRGMSQAGASVLSPWGFKRNALENAKKLASMVGCPDFPSETLKLCLKQRPAQNLIKDLQHFYGFNFMQFGPFAPVVEKGSLNAFLDEEPYWKLKKGEVLDVPWITSLNAQEGLLPTAAYWPHLDELHEMWPNVSQFFLHYNDTVPESVKTSLAKDILEFYLGSNEKICRKNFDKFVQMCTDRLYAFPTEMAAKMQAKVTKSPVYYYFFNYRDGENKALDFLPGNKPLEGVAHGEDSIYFYGLLFTKSFSEKDNRMKDACQDMLYSYASTGKPSFDGTDKWKPTESEKLTYLNITGPENMKMHTIQNLTPVEFWKKLEFLEYEQNVIKDEL